MLTRAVEAALPIAALIVTSSSISLSPEMALLWAAWFLALGKTRVPLWLHPLAPRVPLAAAQNALVGVVVTSILSSWLRNVALGPGDLLVLGAVAFLVAASRHFRLAWGLAGRTRVVVVGEGEADALLVAELRAHPGLNLTTVRLEDNDPSNFEDTILRERPDVVVTTRDGADIVRSILDAGVIDVRVIGLHSFYEHMLGRVPLSQLSPTWFMSVLHLNQRMYSRFTKRAFDCICAVTGLLLLAPMFAVGALLVRLSGGRSILYRQVRLGERGKPFVIVKFRTMIDGAELPGTPKWADEDDPRVTWIGRLLRRSHIDELPQLWNVMRGDMSMVGPRPERPEFLGLLEREVPFWTRRHLMKPGLTGWAQVQTGYASDVATAMQKLSYDLFYLKHQSLALDLAIVLKTGGVALSKALPGRRAEASAACPRSPADVGFELSTNGGGHLGSPIGAGNVDATPEVSTATLAARQEAVGLVSETRIAAPNSPVA